MARPWKILRRKAPPAQQLNPLGPSKKIPCPEAFFIAPGGRALARRGGSRRNKYIILLISNAWRIHRHDTYFYRLSLNQKLLRSNSSSGGACPARVVLAPGAPRKACHLTGQLRPDLVDGSC